MLKTCLGKKKYGVRFFTLIERLEHVGDYKSAGKSVNLGNFASVSRDCHLLRHDLNEIDISINNSIITFINLSIIIYYKIGIHEGIKNVGRCRCKKKKKKLL